MFAVEIEPGYGPFISGQVFALDLPHFYSGVQTITTGPRLLVISAKGFEHDNPPIILDVRTFQRFHVVPPPLPQVSFGQ
jgi:hypothetical protein